MGREERRRRRSLLPLFLRSLLDAPGHVQSSRGAQDDAADDVAGRDVPDVVGVVADEGGHLGGVGEHQLRFFFSFNERVGESRKEGLARAFAAKRRKKREQKAKT